MENQIQINRKQTALIIRQPDKAFMLTDLKNNYPRLTDSEQRVLEARQSGYAFVDMSQDEAKTATTGIIFRVSVICGCQLPTHDAHVNALEHEFLTFLNDFGYFSLTVEEILLAFRMNAAFKLRERVEIYGAVFNIDYAAKVLKLYMSDRYSLDQKLIEKKRDLDADEILEKEANARRGRVIEQYALFLQGVEELNLTDLYMQLDSDGAFLQKNFEEKFMESIQRGYYGDSLTKLSQWGERMEERFRAGKKAVMVLFEALKQRGKTEIYSSGMKLLYPGFELPEETKVPAQEDLPY